MSWEDFDPNKTPEALARLEEERQKQEAYTKANEMSREDFIKKYGTTFVADDKGGNAASEVAGQDVAAYYDRWLDPNRKLVIGTPAGGDEFNQGIQPEITVWNAPGQMAGYKYRDARPYFDAWDNVKPHPESQDLGGVGEAWRTVGRPIATAAAMYFGGWALAGAGGAGAAAAGTAAGTAGGTTAASGLAGMVGMDAGLAATAVNTGALNAGVSLASGKSVGDSIKSGITAGALSVFGGWASEGIGNATSSLGAPASKAIAAVGSGAVTGAAGAAINGQDVGKGAVNGMVAGGISEASKYAGGVAREATGSADVGKAVSTVSNTLLKGGDVKTGLVNAAANYAGSRASDAAGGGIVGDIAATYTKAALKRKPVNKQSLLASLSRNNQTNLEDRFAYNRR